VVDGSWNLRPLPQGGVVTALAVRAMQAELAHDDQRLRTLHTTFVAPVADGTVEVDVDVVCRGRSMSHVRAEVRNPGSDHGHVTTAVFGSARRGFEFTDLEPPTGFVPLSEARSFRDPRPPGADPSPAMPFWDI
jgi:acyl-CoA thioesterase